MGPGRYFGVFTESEFNPLKKKSEFQKFRTIAAQKIMQKHILEMNRGPGYYDVEPIPLKRHKPNKIKEPSRFSNLEMKQKLLTPNFNMYQ